MTAKTQNMVTASIPPTDHSTQVTPPPQASTRDPSQTSSSIPHQPPPTFSLYMPGSGEKQTTQPTHVRGNSAEHVQLPAPPLTPTHHPELHLRTDMSAADSITIPRTRPSAGVLSRSNSFQGSYSPASSAGSPMLSALIGDITPLPSPLVSADSPGPWKFLNRTGSVSSRPTSRGSLSGRDTSWSMTADPTPNSLSPPSFKKKKTYQELYDDSKGSENGVRASLGSIGRSVSEQFSSALSISNNGPRPTILNTAAESGGSAGAVDKEAAPNQGRGSFEEPRLVREEYLGKKRGISRPTNDDIEEQPQLPPMRHALAPSPRLSEAVVDPEIKALNMAEFTALTVPHNNSVKWRGLKKIGQGTFSTVILATSDRSNRGVAQMREIDRDKIVAVKIVENGAAGGASRARIESSLKRELDILKSIKHASLVHLKAFSIQPSRALLVLTYCSGGDLFDFATEHMKAITPKLVRRMFAELVGALMYLHKEGVVHRDVKLENVLINLPAEEILAISNPLTYTRSITTLTDLGLSRRIDPENPLLTTRCGSEDYAAPEILLGQPYDGRQTDAWALGVLLYGVMESRLPFDPLPGSSEHKMRSRTAHRICRCDWKWVKLADTPPPLDENGVDGAGPSKRYDEEWEPGKLVVDGLLRRLKKRIPLEEIATWDWVTGAIQGELEDPPLAEEIAED